MYRDVIFGSALVFVRDRRFQGGHMTGREDNDLWVSVPGPEDGDLGQLPQLMEDWAEGKISWEEHTQQADAEVLRIHKETLDNLEREYKAGDLSRETYEWERKLVLLTLDWGLGKISTEEYQRRHDELMD